MDNLPNIAPDDNASAEALRQAVQDLVDNAPPTRKWVTANAVAPEERGGAKPIQSMNHTHEAIVNWLVANPDKYLRECAAHFGYTQTWLSIIIHSGCFQARLKERQNEMFGIVAEDVNTKLTAVADVGVEKLMRMVEESEDKKFVLEATRTALTSLGFGAKTAPVANQVNAANVQQNFYVASPADLVAARGRISANGTVSPALQSSVPGEALQSEPTDEESAQ